MNSKAGQWLIVAMAAIAMLALFKLMDDMSSAVTEMAGHVGTMSRNMGEMNGHVASLAKDMNEMKTSVAQMNLTIQRMDGTIQRMGGAITRGSEQFQQWNPGEMMQQVMPGTGTRTR